MKWLDWDTETERFGPARMAPPLACISYVQEGDVGLMNYWDAIPWFREKLQDPEIIFCGHHVAYDFAVMAAADSTLIPLIFEAYRNNRVTCTMIRQQLLDIAMGKYRGYWKPCRDKDGTANFQWVKLNYSLDDCHYRATKKRLEKDLWRKRYGELRETPVDHWPLGAVGYAKDDAVATKTLREWQDKICKQIVDAFCSVDAGHIENPDPLRDQWAQAKAAWWMQLMSVWGIRTDPERVDIAEAYVREKREEIGRALLAAKLVRSDGSRDTKAAMARMVIAMKGEENCKKTKKDRIQLDEEACRESGDPLLEDYAEYGSLGTVLSKDIPALRSGKVFPVHSRFNTLLVTGRTSSSAPNIQNVRRLPGIRECFVPRPGTVFLDADYDGLELRTLAQCCMNLFGVSRLAEILNAGDDPHLMLAAEILKISYAEAVQRYEAEDSEVEDARQLAKAANFGFPGGLGYKTFIVYAWKQYGVSISEEDAKKLKENWLRTFPEMARYFQLVSKHAEEDKEEGLIDVQQFVSGRIRGACTYPAACNSYFQGLGADATKNAGFELAYECYVDRSSPLFGCRIVNYIHDQFLVECVEDRAHEAAMRLARVMEEAAAPYLPDVPATVKKPMVARCWSKKAKQVFDENGRLIPWEWDFEVKQRGAA